jgi:hypothetical protein
MRRAYLARSCLFTALLALLAPVRLAGQDPPLPDLAELVAKTRANVRSDRELLSQYTYLERRADIRLSKLAKVSTGPIKVHQVYPGFDGLRTYRRLIEVDGKPVPPAELAKQDRERQREILEDHSVMGFLGKLYKGTTASFERRKINNEIWLPATARFDGSGRALIRKFRVDTVVQYSDYRKFSVETDTTFAIPSR